MAPSLRDWLPAGHLAWFVIDAVDELDLAAFYADYRADGHGRPAHDPALMVALIVYAFAVGERSLRKIERRCVEDVAFRVVAGNVAPDHSTTGRFIERHQERLEGLFVQVLELCARAGLVRAGRIAVDSTKIAANASGLANRSYEQIAKEIFEEAAAVNAAEDERFGDAQGDELPAELADPRTRKARLREAKRQLEAEWQAERQARQELLDRHAEHLARTGRRLTGRQPGEHDMSGDPPGRVNLTDRDSRPVKTPRGFIQGYNAHAVASEDQIILAAELTNRSSDGGMLEPLITIARAQLADIGLAAPGAALADAGYWSASQIQALSADGLTVLVPPDGHARSVGSAIKRGEIATRMRERLADPDGRELYRHRQTMIEPIFGHTKLNRRLERFKRRGLAACRTEWQLICATHNLLKLWRATTTPAA